MEQKKKIIFKFNIHPTCEACRGLFIKNLSGSISSQASYSNFTFTYLPFFSISIFFLTCFPPSEKVDALHAPPCFGAKQEGGRARGGVPCFPAKSVPCPASQPLRRRQTPCFLRRHGGSYVLCTYEAPYKVLFGR
jgi:hypothetical protein